MIIFTVTTGDDRTKYYRQKEVALGQAAPSEKLVWMEEVYPLSQMNQTRLLALLERIEKWHAEARENYRTGQRSETVWSICDDLANTARCKVEAVLVAARQPVSRKEKEKAA